MGDGSWRWRPDETGDVTEKTVIRVVDEWRVSVRWWDGMPGRAMVRGFVTGLADSTSLVAMAKRSTNLLWHGLMSSRWDLVRTRKATGYSQGPWRLARPGPVVRLLLRLGQASLWGGGYGWWLSVNVLFFFLFFSCKDGSHSVVAELGV